MTDPWLAGGDYEAFMGRWSRPLARAFVRWLAPEPSSHWLECGCGTGALTTALRDLASPASIVACDPATDFVEHARASLGDARVTFAVAGAEDPPRREGGFDAIVSSLVLNFVLDPLAALVAARGRVRAGGVVAACVWDYAEGMEFLRRFWDAAIDLDPASAALDEGRRFPLCRPLPLTALFVRAGFARVEAGSVEVPTEFADFDDYWSPLQSGTGPAPAYVAALGPDRREALRARLAERLPLAADGRIRLRARAWAVRGSNGTFRGGR